RQHAGGRAAPKQFAHNLPLLWESGWNLVKRKMGLACCRLTNVGRTIAIAPPSCQSSPARYSVSPQRKQGCLVPLLALRANEGQPAAQARVFGSLACAAG